ncbi:MAG: hypothetical protein K0R80_1591 [Clostridia bacterium]|jgi:hypothetical protein|nr:hypothetical protein [Clostridia bacterium]
MGYQRLTTTSEITESATLIALCESCGEDGCDANCEEYQNNNCVGCPVQESFARLAAYEDSGFSPEQVRALSSQNTIDAIFCESRNDGNCSTRDYGQNEYKNPCYKCCLGCKGAIEMSCTFVCSQVAEHYYPDVESEG